MHVAVAVGNLWLVWLATLKKKITLQPIAHTNHKFPAATAMGVPCEVKSTVHIQCMSCPLQSETPIQATSLHKNYKTVEWTTGIMKH